MRVPLDLRKRWSLERDECVMLGEMEVLIEEYFDQPMDIEWAFEGSELYALQMRPITTLPGMPFYQKEVKKA